MGMETVCYQKRVLKFTIDHGLDMKALPVLQFYKKKKKLIMRRKSKKQFQNQRKLYSFMKNCDDVNLF